MDIDNDDEMEINDDEIVNNNRPSFPAVSASKVLVSIF